MHGKYTGKLWSNEQRRRRYDICSIINIQNGTFNLAFTPLFRWICMGVPHRNSCISVFVLFISHQITNAPGKHFLISTDNVCRRTKYFLVKTYAWRIILKDDLAQKFLKWKHSHTLRLTVSDNVLFEVSSYVVTMVPIPNRLTKV